MTATSWPKRQQFHLLCSLPLGLSNTLLYSRLKYLYLMFVEEDLTPFDKFIFNTEAHPFAIFEWTAQEKMDWGIS